MHAYLPTLLIAQSRLEAMNQAFSSSKQASYTNGLILLAIAVAALGLAIAIFFFVKYRQERTVDSPLLLFRELCSAHSIRRGDQRLLLQLAELRKLSDPCQLMLDSRLWILDPQQDKIIFTPHRVQRLELLKRGLFTPPTVVR